MSIVRKTVAAPPSKEAVIMDAAYRLFLRHGYRKVTMGEIAKEADLSRPTLYAAFANKGDIFGAIVKSHLAEKSALVEERLAGQKRLKERLTLLFEVWMIEPVAAIIGSENGADLLANAGEYAPEAIAELYRQFEKYLVEILSPEMKGQGTMNARDLARVLTLAAKGLKGSTASLTELKRMISGLIEMALATAGQR
jgi:AcrR family transcriptional regulator